MKKLVLDKITGFASRDNVIKVTDANNRTLYYFENEAGNEITFNLIPGTWYSSNRLMQLRRPLRYKTPRIAKPELNRPVKPMRFRVGDNPHKCTVDFSPADHVDIFVDHEINEQAIPFKAFVYGHEVSHFMYGGKPKGDKGYFESELKCDIAACKEMLDRGFNPSQCVMGIELCLTEEDGARWRKDGVFKWLKKVKVR